MTLYANDIPLRELVGRISIPATTERFLARDKFVLNYGRKAKSGVRISFLGDNFKEWFLDKIEEPVAETTLRYAKLLRSEVDGPIMYELGDARETTLAQIYALMGRQANGEEGVLLTNGHANIFYVNDAGGILRAVHVGWDSGVGGWDVIAHSVTLPSRWDGDDLRVFSRNSSVAVAV